MDLGLINFNEFCFFQNYNHHESRGGGFTPKIKRSHKSRVKSSCEFLEVPKDTQTNNITDEDFKKQLHENLRENNEMGNSTG